MYTTYAYRSIKESNLSFPYTKYAVLSFDDEDPETALSPSDYFKRFVNKRHKELEEVNSTAVDEWVSLKTEVIAYKKELLSLLSSKGEQYKEYYLGWKYGIDKFMKKFLLASSKLEILINGTNENLLSTKFYTLAPESIKEAIPLATGNGFKWLVNFEYTEEEQKSIKNVRAAIAESEYAKFYKEEAKEIIRTIRNKFVRSLEDTAADQSKMIAMLAGAISRIISVIPEESFLKFSEADQYSMRKFLETQKEIYTRGDVQFSEEGFSLIKKLYDRESQINDIIEMVYSNLKD